MNLKSHISAKEFKLLLVIGFLASSFAFLSFTYDVIKDFNNSVEEKQEKLRETANNDGSYQVYGGSSRGLWSVLFSSSTFLIFFALLKTQRFILPLLLTIFSFQIFVNVLIVKWQNILEEDFLSRFSFLEVNFLITNAFTYLSFFLVLILLFWQISIMLRIKVKTLQKEIY